MNEEKLSLGRIFLNGLIFENPVFVQLLGMCPTLATSTTALNALGMGLSATAVLICSNLVISALRKLIPDKVRIAAYIIIIAGFVTAVDLLLQAFLPDLSESLGVFIPLIVVNCIILARAEAFASKHGVLPSAMDGLGMGLGFTLALVLLGSVREILGSGTWFGIQVLGDFYKPMVTMSTTTGGFLVLGFMIAGVQAIGQRRQRKGADR